MSQSQDAGRRVGCRPAGWAPTREVQREQERMVSRQNRDRSTPECAIIGRQERTRHHDGSLVLGPANSAVEPLDRSPSYATADSQLAPCSLALGGPWWPLVVLGLGNWSRRAPTALPGRRRLTCGAQSWPAGGGERSDGWTIKHRSVRGTRELLWCTYMVYWYTLVTRVLIQRLSLFPCFLVSWCLAVLLWFNRCLSVSLHRVSWCTQHPCYLMFPS